MTKGRPNPTATQKDLAEKAMALAARRDGTLGRVWRGGPAPCAGTLAQGPLDRPGRHTPSIQQDDRDIMQVQINTANNIDGREALISGVEADVRAGLARFGDRLTRVAVHVGDEADDRHRSCGHAGPGRQWGPAQDNDGAGPRVRQAG